MDYALILVGLVALIFGGDILVRGASGIAKKMKLSPLVVGMTVVAFGTSSPELMVSVNAALMDSPEIALGNVIGSNIANVTMILGITVLIYPLLIDKNSKFIDWPVMLFASILFYLFALNGRISSLEGTIFFAGLVVFTIFLIRQSFKNNKATEEASHEKIPNIWLSIGKNIAGLVLLYFGSEWLVSGSINVAKNFRIEERIIGVTVVAVGTSLPELAASIMAALRKEDGIAIGNLVGSNIFNILGVIGLTAIINPTQVSDKIINPDMYLMLAITLAIGMILFCWKKIARWHGVVLLLSYIVYVFITVKS